ncbi:hypothetical protein BN59_00005 [Legionella massiliensis]|uniref:DUF1460 domain-containing protein n=1 Tax=Legionella massiliensis TaxID=1034943 RepID=A0A078KRZ1_9GAMM|nr:N-acetylmuramoyl-L-alanine amidase-like domain-containing protein [Legionella massiliensis]CDZ75747.1 hypothetical protein BN59_00005 [Legionella massiliensis]CEE11485.1 hypothetical protein BN1094_00005 [Legionella massiliensis]
MRLVYLRKTRKWIAFTTFLLLLSPSLEAEVSPIQQQTDAVITKLYQTLDNNPPTNMPNRLDAISSEFIGKVYLLGALGEGPDALYDQEPRYRMDAFDCDTYVTTVLALALAKNQQGFKQCLSKVRYKDGQVDFISRNHFMSLDWNPNNQQQNFIQDITESIKDGNHQAVAQIATALIDKPSWYEHFSNKNIRLNSADENEHTKRLAELKVAGSKLEKQNASIPYLPLTSLFDSQGHPNLFLFEQIPNGAIIEIVRPNWNLRELIGTNLNVSHLGFAFWKNGTLLFRQASSQYGKVVEVPLIDYLRETMKSPTIKGINVEVVVPQSPLDEQCINPKMISKSP